MKLKIEGMMVMIFQNIPKINYEGADSTNPFSFKYYDADRIIGGKPMREQLKFAMSYWHTLCGDRTDMFGRGTMDKRFVWRTVQWRCTKIRRMRRLS